MSPPGQGPPDPLTALAAGAATVHEIFMAYVNAGFSRPEALHMVTAILAASVAHNPPAPERNE